MILAIDPGTFESAYVVMDKDLKPIKFDKISNDELLDMIYEEEFNDCSHSVIEMVASYGMAVGKEVFETCVWIGRFYEALEIKGFDTKYIYRREEKKNLCNSMKANDSNIIQALVDRFAPYTKNKGKGTKKDPGYFYGFKFDIWQSYAVGVTYYDMYLKEEN